MDPTVLTVDELLDVLEDVGSSPAARANARGEVRRRAESRAVSVTTPDAILARAVEELRKAGRFDVAHACLVLFAGATPDPILLGLNADPDGGLAYWLVKYTREMCREMWVMREGCRPCVARAGGGW